MHQDFLIIISAPSGGGKDAIIRGVRKKMPRLGKLVSSTTRPKREREKEGREHYFITKKQFEQKLKNQDFIEHNFYADNYYGTEKEKLAEALKKYHTVIINVEVNGKKSFAKLKTPQISIFLMPENMEILKKRIEKRGGTDENLIKKRLETAEKELKQAKFYDYQVLNKQGEMDRTIDEVACIIKTTLKALDKKPVLR